VPILWHFNTLSFSLHKISDQTARDSSEYARHLKGFKIKESLIGHRIKLQTEMAAEFYVAGVILVFKENVLEHDNECSLTSESTTEYTSTIMVGQLIQNHSHIILRHA
jgi:hypothetical protein